MNDEVQTIKRVDNFDELYAGRFLKAGELKGKHVTLKISDVYAEKLVDDKGGAKFKAILLFSSTEKQLVACKTNGLCIKAMFGKTLEDWKGKHITLHEDVWNGEPCIRIWGSPDIEADFELEVALPRRRPFKKVMHKVERPAKAA